MPMSATIRLECVQSVIDGQTTTECRDKKPEHIILKRWAGVLPVGLYGT
jgi:hypothetical protein